MQFPQKSEGKELKILIQPETQHRARYLTEGSRGSVKDRTQQGFPTVKVTWKSYDAVPIMNPVVKTLTLLMYFALFKVILFEWFCIEILVYLFNIFLFLERQEQ